MLTLERVRAMNPNHDELGRFAESDSSGAGGKSKPLPRRLQERQRRLADLKDQISSANSYLADRPHAQERYIAVANTLHDMVATSTRDEMKAVLSKSDLPRRAEEADEKHIAIAVDQAAKASDLAGLTDEQRADIAQAFRDDLAANIGSTDTLRDVIKNTVRSINTGEHREKVIEGFKAALDDAFDDNLTNAGYRAGESNLADAIGEILDTEGMPKEPALNAPDSEWKAWEAATDKLSEENARRADRIARSMTNAIARYFGGGKVQGSAQRPSILIGTQGEFESRTLPRYHLIPAEGHRLARLVAMNPNHDPENEVPVLPAPKIRAAEGEHG